MTLNFTSVEIIETKDNKEGPDVNGEVGGEDGDHDDLSDGGSNTGLIAAGATIPLILLAVIAVIAILVLFVWKRRFEYNYSIFQVLTLFFPTELHRRGSKSLNPTYSTPYQPGSVPLGPSKRYSTGADQLYSTPDQPTKHTVPAPSTTELPPVLYQNFDETVQQFTGNH